MPEFEIYCIWCKGSKLSYKRTLLITFVGRWLIPLFTLSQLYVVSNRSFFFPFSCKAMCCRCPLWTSTLAHVTIAMHHSDKDFLRAIIASLRFCAHVVTILLNCLNPLIYFNILWSNLKVFGYAVILIWNKRKERQAPLWVYWSPSITNSIGPACGIQALKYISYPAQVFQ